MKTTDQITANKRRANILFREWSPLLGDALAEGPSRLGDSLSARIADMQRVMDLTWALTDTLQDIRREVTAEFSPRLQAMRRSLAAQKAHQTRKARKAQSAP